jgi:hypothetical protein
MHYMVSHETIVHIRLFAFELLGVTKARMQETLVSPKLMSLVLQGCVCCSEPKNVVSLDFDSLLNVR